MNETAFASSYKPQWTDIGINCHASQADCRNCQIHKVYGMNKNYDGIKKCHQPESNQRLLDKAISHTAKFKPVKPVEIPDDKKRPGGYRLTEAEGNVFRQEIIRIIPILEKATTRKIVSHLNNTGYMGWADWTIAMIYGHLQRMKKAGVLKVVGYEISESRVEVLAVADPEKLKNLIRKSYRPVAMQRMIFNEKG